MNPNPSPEKEQPSARSQLALDGASFCITDIPNGLGAFTATYLQSDRHWDPGTIGVALASAGIAAMVFQIPAAALVDVVKQKKGLMIWCSIGVAVAALGIVFIKPLFATVFFESVIGALTTFIAPLMAAISLGLVGKAHFDARLGRTSSYSHAGNVLAAVLAGWLAFSVNKAWIFYLIAILNFLTVGFILLVRSREIDFDMARGGDGNNQEAGDRSASVLMRTKTKELLDALKDRKMIILGVCFFSFQLASAGILQLVGQNFGNGQSNQSALYMAGAIIVAQMVMVPASLVAGKLAGSWGRKYLLLFAFACVPIRAFCCAWTTTPWILVLLQALDGAGAGIFNVVSVLMISDFAKGTPRFSTLQGYASMTMAMGAGLSALLGGTIAKLLHFPIAFITLGIIGFASLVIFTFLLPKSMERKAAEE